MKFAIANCGTSWHGAQLVELDACAKHGYPRCDHCGHPKDRILQVPPQYPPRRAA